MITNSLILSYVTFIYAVAGTMYLFAWIFNKQGIGKAATWVTLAAVLGNTAGIILRWVESYALGSEYGHAPLTNLYESLAFFSWTMGVMYLVIESKYKNRVIGAFCLPLAFLALAYASLSPGREIEPLIPALKSNWLIAHVFTCFVGYASFASAFGVGIAFLIKSNKEEPEPAPGEMRLLSTQWLDELIQKLIMFGFLFLTVGIITGAVWANSAWGRYWGWDPKETWSLVTWLIYAAMLHFRLMRGWRGKRIALFSIIGFAAVLFTYFGVNLLPGLHSYGAFK